MGWYNYNRRNSRHTWNGRKHAQATIGNIAKAVKGNGKAKGTTGSKGQGANATGKGDTGAGEEAFGPCRISTQKFTKANEGTRQCLETLTLEDGDATRDNLVIILVLQKPHTRQSNRWMHVLPSAEPRVSNKRT